MAKQSGLGDNFYIGGYDLSGDINSLGRIGGGPTALEFTAINASAMERQGGLRDGAVEFASFFNPSAGQAHPVLSALPTTDVHTAYFRGTTLGNPVACLVGKQANYDGSRQQDGSFPFAAQVLGSRYALEWGRSLTAGRRTDTGATNGGSVDFGTGSTSFGAQLYLQVFSFSGTDVTVTVQESSDDGSVDAFAGVTGGAFTQITSAPTVERLQTSRSQTVERYLRAVTTTSGGFSSLVFAVVAVRNTTAVIF